MHILVTGGAGYIGSVMTKTLLKDGHTVVVADSLERGRREAIDKRAEFIKGDLKEQAFVESIFTQHQFDAVMHFAAYISVGESMQEPASYFRNNISVVLSVLEAMRKNNVNRFIFSSTAAVYGNPRHTPIMETHVTDPTSVYGESKLAAERIIQWYNKIYGLRYMILRYFNASGAMLDGSLGEQHVSESHIIPNAILAILQNNPFALYGNKYPTPDGTCIRDYIHVLDLTSSHLLALHKITQQEGGYTYNVGTGTGYSNKEVIDMVSRVSKKEILVSQKEPRPGDPGELVADATKIKKELGFIPKYSDLKTIVESAWKWHTKQAEKTKSLLQ